MDFDSFIRQAEREHADDPEGVAQRLQTQGPALLANEAQLARLAHLSQHVLGEHLGSWDQGLACMQQLAGLPLHNAQGDSGAAVRRCSAALALCAGQADALAGLDRSDRIRAAATAASNMAARDTVAAAGYFQQALQEADATALPATDPATRALATNGWNLACMLENQATRSADEVALMLSAAQASRRYWERAGGWMEVERAEYRLAMSWLQAGDASRARQHAQQCVDLVAAQPEAPALERYFGWEALGRAERALGDVAGHAQALALARAAFAELAETDRSWCQASLDALEPFAPAPA